MPFASRSSAAHVSPAAFHASARVSSCLHAASNASAASLSGAPSARRRRPSAYMSPGRSAYALSSLNGKADWSERNASTLSRVQVGARRMSGVVPNRSSSSVSTRGEPCRSLNCEPYWASHWASSASWALADPSWPLSWAHVASRSLSSCASDSVASSGISPSSTLAAASACSCGFCGCSAVAASASVASPTRANWASQSASSSSTNRPLPLASACCGCWTTGGAAPYERMPPIMPPP